MSSIHGPARWWLPLGAALAMLAASCQRVDVNSTLQQAGSAAAEGDFQAALELVEVCVDAAPENTSALLLQGLCLHELRRGEDALDVLDRAASLASDEFLPHYFYGWILCENQRFGDAVVPLKRAYELRDQHPDVTADVLVLLSKCCVEQNLPEGKGYLQALRRFRDFADSAALYNSLAILHLYEGDHENALHNFMLAWRKDPDSATVLQNLGVLYDSYLHNTTEAMRYYRYSLKASQLVNDTSRQGRLRYRLLQMAKDRLRPGGGQD